MRTRLERALALGLLALLLGLALAAQILQPAEESVAGSVASADAEGRRALLLLLRELGFRADPWNDAPGALPRDGSLLWLARPPGIHLRLPEPSQEAEPDAGAERPENDAEEPAVAQTDSEAPADDPPDEPRAPSPASLGLRAESHYRRFVEEGGTLVLEQSEEASAFLEEIGLEACSDVRASDAAAAGPRSFRDHRGEVLEVEVGTGGVLLPPPVGSTSFAEWWEEQEEGVVAEAGAVADTGTAFAVVVPAGSGQVVLLGDDAFLANSRIGERGHALLAVRIAEEFAHGARVLFDEYALGLWPPRTAGELLASPTLVLASVHVLLLLLFLVWRSSWVREFPRDPPGHEALSPLLRARSLGALLVRAGRHDLLAGFLTQGAPRRFAQGAPRWFPHGASRRVAQGASRRVAQGASRRVERSGRETPRAAPAPPPRLGRMPGRGAG